ncbi:MAG: FKBP-type peptidyl-prolyl cis-trans isomerase [Deferrisomatales bacterium]
MKIADRTYVAIDYTLTLDNGEAVDGSEPGEPMGFIFGTGKVIRGLEQNLEGLEAGSAAEFTVETAEGYGEPDPKLWREIPRENFPPDLELTPGMGFEARGPHGPVLFRVKEASDETVTADFNHPLAGERLHFKVQVVEVREPRAEELAELMDASCSPSSCSSCSCSGGCG